MWGTSQGDRTLAGEEGALVRKSVGYLRDMITASIDLDEPHSSEVGLFNKLQATQQLAILHEVAYALLAPATPIPTLTAVREATVYAIYRELISLIELEIELGSGPETRSLIVAACLYVQECQTEWGKDEFEETKRIQPAVDSEDLAGWSQVIEFLVNQVLWDRDFELEGMFADHDPEKIADIKAYLGINEDYFSTPAPDAYSDEYQRIDRELVSLSRNEV